MDPLHKNIIEIPPPYQGSSSGHGQPTHHVFFIPGNPGLISFYNIFLSFLSRAITVNVASQSHARVRIFGQSLRGFELPQADLVVNLQEQIDHVEAVLLKYASEQAKLNRAEAPKLILMAHSVGAYISLELIRRQQQRLERSRAIGGEKKEASTVIVEPQIVGGVMLFPTVTQIAQSANGRRFSKLFAIPGIPLVGAVVTALLASVIPLSVLKYIVATVMGLNRDEEAVGVVTEFLRSSRGRGVRTSLTMAHDEMRTITTDRWNDGIWGSPIKRLKDVPKPPKMFFLFGENDHWVADHTRDELIAARGAIDGETWKPKMEIEETGVPHGFCIRHNEPVASKVVEYIKAIVADTEESRL